ncbi:hypothetical protein ACFQV8_03160 [Pseudonocardia benzenivorans]
MATIATHGAEQQEPARRGELSHRGGQDPLGLSQLGERRDLGQVQDDGRQPLVARLRDDRGAVLGDQRRDGLGEAAVADSRDERRTAFQERLAW